MEPKEPNPKDKLITEHIDSALEEYKKFIALDHQLACDGLADELIYRRKPHQDDDLPPAK